MAEQFESLGVRLRPMGVSLGGEFSSTQSLEGEVTPGVSVPLDIQLEHLSKGSTLEDMPIASAVLRINERRWCSCIGNNYTRLL